MKERATGRHNVWTPVLYSVVLIAGILIGFYLRDNLRYKRDLRTILDRNDHLEEIINLIHDKYVDSVNTNILYADAISGILKGLDPHTVYISATDLEGVNENLEGGFYGIGVEFIIVRDTIEITSVIANGPSQKAGLHAGDQILKVEDTVVAGSHITNERILSLLKGKQNTKVSITVNDITTKQQHPVALVRGIVPIPSVDASFMADSTTGFIKISRFSATTYDEFMAAMKSLKAQGMQQLVLDLRDNPGGYLEATTAIADELLDDNELIVYTKGLHTAKLDYKAEKEGLFEHGRLAVLVNESAASAAEILAGAIQDWDRGVIVGRRTFGKGLVQEQYDLSNGAALRLTVARYYTPSGRCIQRSFANGKAAYAEDFEKRFSIDELTDNDSLTKQDTVKYYTSKQRVVFGGGGIKPDVYVPFDTTHVNVGLMNMMFNDDVKGVLWDYFITNRTKLLSYGTIADYQRQFNAEDELVSTYVSKLKGPAHAAAVSLLGKGTYKTYFRNQMKAQLARYIFHDSGYYNIAIKEDKTFLEALKILYSDKYLTLVGR